MLYSVYKIYRVQNIFDIFNNTIINLIEETLLNEELLRVSLGDGEIDYRNSIVSKLSCLEALVVSRLETRSSRKLSIPKLSCLEVRLSRNSIVVKLSCLET